MGDLFILEKTVKQTYFDFGNKQLSRTILLLIFEFLVDGIRINKRRFGVSVLWTRHIVRDQRVGVVAPFNHRRGAPVG